MRRPEQLTTGSTQETPTYLTPFSNHPQTLPTPTQTSPTQVLWLNSTSQTSLTATTSFVLRTSLMTLPSELNLLFLPPPHLSPSPKPSFSHNPPISPHPATTRRSWTEVLNPNDKPYFKIWRRKTKMRITTIIIITI